MSHAIRSVLTAEHSPARELLSDAIGVLAISVTTVAVLWLPAILSA